MSGPSLLVVPAVALIAALLGGGGSVGVALLVGVLGGAALWWADQLRITRLAERVERWAAGTSNVPVRLRGGGRWRQFSRAVNTLGAAIRDTRSELAEASASTSRLVDAIEEPALLFGSDQRLLAANDAARQLLAGDGGAGGDAEPGELPPPSIAAGATSLSALGSSAAASAVEEAHATGRRVSLDEGRGDQELHLSAAPLDDHVLVTLSDHTRARRVEALRRDFVTNASHELKTPVTAIRALVEAMEVAPEARRAGLVTRLGEESQRLVRLVHDLLDLRLLDEPSGGLELNSVDLAELARAAAQQVAGAAGDRDVDVLLEVPAHAVVVGVERELRLVVDNLVSNAVHYNVPGGQVVISLRPEPGAQVLTVRDTGIGIPRASVERIFERFYRVDVARSRERGGTGLGLSIVRNAVERHGGSVNVETLVGDGTTFTVRIPVQPPG